MAPAERHRGLSSGTNRSAARQPGEPEGWPLSAAPGLVLPSAPSGQLEGLPVPVCPAVYACAEVRPLLCLVCATPLHVCVCVCACVCVSVGAHLPA